MKRFLIALTFSVTAICLMGFAVYFAAAGPHHKTATQAVDIGASSPLSSATVSFGGWMTTTPIDRFPNNANTQFPRLQNHHALVPEIAKIKAGGTVNFIIGGFHVVTVYDNGTQPGDIDTTLTTTPANLPGPPIINDPENRIYRGLDPSILPATAAQDRVEVVHFENPGVYLVICSVLPHFQEGMYGYVRVLPGKAVE
jgi:plastocyanin